MAYPMPRCIYNSHTLIPILQRDMPKAFADFTSRLEKDEDHCTAAGSYLGKALAVKGVEVLVLKGLADLNHPVRPEVEQRHSIPILHKFSSSHICNICCRRPRWKLTASQIRSLLMQSVHDTAVDAHLWGCSCVAGDLQAPYQRIGHVGAHADVRCACRWDLYLNGAYRLAILTHNNKGRQPLVRDWLLAITCLQLSGTVSAALKAASSYATCQSKDVRPFQMTE